METVGGASSSTMMPVPVVVAALSVKVAFVALLNRRTSVSWFSSSTVSSSVCTWMYSTRLPIVRVPEVTAV